MRVERRFREVRDELQLLPVFENYSAGLAIEAAANYRFLRAKGITIRKSIDCLIATFCIQHGYQLLHHDSDFVPYAAYLNLKILDPCNGAINQ
jgi:predicted nucleic acid-binding protein